jgi:molybdate transport system substrate-binding protein
MKAHIRHAVCAALAACAVACAQITVACAANMQFAMQGIDSAFAKQGGSARIIYGASGKFAAQIKSGAPFDVFVSADMEYPDSLCAWKQAVGKPRVYAYGKLVLWSMKPGLAARGIAGLADSSVKAIAVADPARAPYGRESIRALKKAGVYDAVSRRLVFGESIGQAAQYIVSGSADAGFCAKAIVLSPRMQGTGAWAEVDSSLYDRISQGVVVCRYGADNNPSLSQKFVAFLLGEEARAVLGQYGYALP